MTNSGALESVVGEALDDEVARRKRDIGDGEP